MHSIGRGSPHAGAKVALRRNGRKMAETRGAGPDQVRISKTGSNMQGLALIGIYVVFALAGQALGFGLSSVIERYVPAAGLPAFLAIFFAMLLIAWPISVRLMNWL